MNNPLTDEHQKAVESYLNKPVLTFSEMNDRLMAISKNLKQILKTKKGNSGINDELDG